MDSLRGPFEQSNEYDEEQDEAYGADDPRELPPSAIGTDERRMQVRAYNHWASLLENRNFPAIDDLDPAGLPDFGPYSVLLDFSAGIENPGVSYLGDSLAAECDANAGNIETLEDIPARSLLSRITDHYMQILANQAPIGFEAEFTNQQGKPIAYRGILLPFSSDDDTIDFIYGVINWKELADARTADELLLEIDQALDAPEPAAKEAEPAPLADWADGPAAHTSPTDIAPSDDALPEPAFGTLSEDDWDDNDVERFAVDYGDSEEELDEDGEIIAGESEDEEGTSASLIGLNLGIPKKKTQAIDLDAPPIDLAEIDAAADTDAPNPSALAEPAVPVAYEPAIEPIVEPEAAPVAMLEEAAADAQDAPTGVSIDLPDLDPAEMGLGDWLAAAREQADQARNAEDRSRAALYEAIGRAHDFALAADEAPEDFAELLADYGIEAQDRAPMTAVAKLVFGSDYDKTRLSEYAAALEWARRHAIARGDLAEHLRTAPGGLKGVVAEERRHRKGDSPEPDEHDEMRPALARRLRALPARDMGDLDPDGEEFALVAIRRLPDGEIELIGEIPHEVKLVERAVKKLLG